MTMHEGMVCFSGVGLGIQVMEQDCLLCDRHWLHSSARQEFQANVPSVSPGVQPCFFMSTVAADVTLVALLSLYNLNLHCGHVTLLPLLQT